MPTSSDPEASASPLLDGPIPLAPELIAEMVEMLPVGVMLFAPVRRRGKLVDLRWQAVNGAALRALHPRKAREQLLGARLLEVIPDLAGSELLRQYFNVLETGLPCALLHRVPPERAGDDQEHWFEIKAQRCREHLLVTFADITRRRRVERDIRELAFRDALTGLHNRRYFLARAPGLLALGQRQRWSVALLYFDLNGFKEVNDSWGHSSGDALLQSVAQRLGRERREEDILFRSGGDEFAWFVPNAGRQEAEAVAQRVAAAFAQPFEVDGVQHAVGASIGVAVVPAAEASVNLLLERADAAMYRAKARKGREPIAIELWHYHDAPLP